eukprot:TRINITY_DN19789_c0_g1_i1.p1 TRINITY_DN19789_c0_g1~~TRINITY_DN19789_c0_g1_i1.p1  ORF type:complete len:1166 (+),score=65.42 TRINITY_DN19789_c0_g1_i1:148-3645(+)
MCIRDRSLTLSVLAILALLSLVPVSAAACVSRRRRAVTTCGFTSTSNCTCLSGTCGMLCELFIATRGASWLRSDGWGNLSRPICGRTYKKPFLVPWSGLICSTWGARELHLNGNNLTGALPASLGTSTDLLHMYLQSNSLSGSIPQSLTTSPLATFDAGNNSLSGTIPQNWTGVLDLILSYNRLAGTLGNLCQYTSLITLQVARNRLSGTLPGSFGGYINRLEINENRVSGTIPTTLSSLRATQIYLHDNKLSGTLSALPATTVSYVASGNRISGTIGPGVSNRSLLHSLIVSNNSISGTLAPWSSSLLFLWVQSNRISGTIPAGPSAVLRSLVLGHNALSGTIPLPLASPSLAFLSIQDNSISGTLPPFSLPVPGPNTYSGMHGLVFFGNALSGTVPPITKSLQLLAGGSNKLSGTIPNMTRLVSLSHNRISGTLSSHPDAMDVDLTRNRVSGTIPATLLASTRLKSLLLNDVRLSGTLPVVNATSSLISLGLARNYLQGGVGDLHGPNLQTLLLSSNYFSCEASELEHAVLLGQGYFNDPVPDGVRELTVKAYFTYHDLGSWDPVRRYSAVVLAFPGNPQLTVSAGYLPDRAPGRLLREDQVRQGRRRLFPGDSSDKLLVFIVLPALLLGHALAVCATLRVFSSESTSSFRTRLKHYFWPRTRYGPYVVLRLFQDSARGVCALCAVGIGLQTLIFLTPGVSGDTGCVFGFGQTTIAHLSFGAWHQWMWVILMSLLMVASHYVCEECRRRDYATRAKRKTLVGWASQIVDAVDPRLCCIDQWRAKSTGKRIRSVAMFHVLLLLVLCIASVPACGFVLCQNVPTDSAWYITIFGSPVGVAATKVVFRGLLVPRASNTLAILRHRWRPRNMGRVLKVCETHAQLVFLFNVVTVLVAPMLAVFVLDEACLTYYTLFTPKLTALLDGWGLGRTGFDSYRLGFCSRTLVSEFAPVWTILLLMDAMLGPAIMLVRTWPNVKLLEAKARVLFNRPVTHGLFEDTQEPHVEVATFLSSLLTTVVFGVAVAPLLVLAPLVVLFQNCSHHWRLDREQAGEEGVSPTSRAVGHLFVHPPIGLFQYLVHIGCWVFCGFILFDFQFDIGPVICFTLVSAVELALSVQRRCIGSSSAPNEARGLEIMACPSVRLNPISTIVDFVKDRVEPPETIKFFQ